VPPLRSTGTAREARVLIVTPGYLPRLGGMERQCALLAGAFQRMGFAVTVLTERTYPHLPLRAELDGVEVVRMRTSERRNALTFALVGFQMAAYLLANRGAFRFAVVRTLTFPALVTGLLKTLRLLRYRTLVTAETGGAADDVIALRGYRAWRTFCRILAHHDRLNSICDANYRHFRELGFDEAKLTRIPNGVDVGPFPASSYPERVSRFAFLGRITREKGVWELLDAFQVVHERQPGTSLLIAGDGEDQQALRAAVAERGLDSAVEFLGRIPYERLGEFFDRTDCLVLPSYSEGLPMAVLEAAAHKRAIVATDVGDLKRLFGDSIFICRPGDADDLADAMAAALDGANVARLDYGDTMPALAVDRVAADIAANLDHTTVPDGAQGGAPGWLRLWRHSYRLGLGWMLRGAHNGWKGWRVGLQRLLVPLDPWRYYELGRVAERPFDGPCLDVSSPKLLMSLLQHEGRGDWIGIDLFASEVESWRQVDPSLRLEVDDATALSFPSDSFERCACISVIEHIPGNGDAVAMSEIWRVLKPGGVLHLTTNVALAAKDVFVDKPVYGEASWPEGDGIFFERQYSPQTLEERLLALPWQVEHREFACQRDESIERRFYSGVPLSYLYGGLLRLHCSDNFEVGPSADVLRGSGGHGAVYLELRKPLDSSAS
jgi:glycosyltransferase involved in cell wall biosynthesis/SAM-dependent methyltransferase